MKKLYIFFILINFIYSFNFIEKNDSSSEFMYTDSNSTTRIPHGIIRISKFKFINIVSKNEAKFIGHYLYDENFNKIEEFKDNNNNFLKLERKKTYYNVYEFENDPNRDTYIRLSVSNNPFIIQYTLTNEISKNGFDSGIYYSEFKNRFGSIEFDNKILPGLGKNVFLIFKFETK